MFMTDLHQARASQAKTQPKPLALLQRYGEHGTQQEMTADDLLVRAEFAATNNPVFETPATLNGEHL